VTDYFSILRRPISTSLLIYTDFELTFRGESRNAGNTRLIIAVGGPIKAPTVTFTSTKLSSYCYMYSWKHEEAQ